MAVWLAGDMIGVPREQQNMVDLLARTEEVHGWPTRDISDELTGLWSKKT